LKKVLDYKAKHTPEETEATIHEWYDQHQSIIVNALQDQKNVQSRMQDAMQSPDPKYYRSYAEAQADQVHAVRSAIEDNKLLHKEGFMIGRIRMAFQKVKRELSRTGLKYDWFKAEESFVYFYQ
jgi:hypothetical protein